MIYFVSPTSLPILYFAFFIFTNVNVVSRVVNPCSIERAVPNLCPALLWSLDQSPSTIFDRGIHFQLSLVFKPLLSPTLSWSTVLRCFSFFVLPPSDITRLMQEMAAFQDLSITNAHETVVQGRQKV